MSQTIYLDHNATTTIRPEVIDLVAQIMADTGNASSVHCCGRTARSAISKARSQIAAIAGTIPEYVTFNSGATEANNSVLRAFKDETIMITATEHPSVREAATEFASNVIKAPVTPDGLIDRAAFEALIAEHKPALISMMMVNSETGVIQPIAELSKIARKIHPDVFIHTDAVQAAGRIKIDMPALGVDYLSLSAHKLGGPQGVGAVICAPGSRPAKFMHGGGQEKRQRAGTENVAGIAGFGLSAELAMNFMAEYEKLAVLRDHLENFLTKTHNNSIRIFGQDAPRVANTCCVSCIGYAAQTQLMALDLEGICVSSGSACSSGSPKPSQVLQAMDATQEELDSSLRISLGWNSCQSDIDGFIKAWSKIIGRIQSKKENGEGAVA